ncbi:PrsW family intramembrane metalloprotease [Nocardiopsis alkaliphila]|uniref:PrsW family intramembrane metalloprotease n=1 Tax=Nocardiopsis alkaliphila TaxID=225762 RepID=UPI000349DF90|nr:PrsW family glutamic-type intramembrane protease [Nocardiopsis alkaliphila]
MSHARPEPDAPFSADGRVPSPRASDQEHEAIERPTGPPWGPTRHRRAPRLAAAALFGLLCVVGFVLMLNALFGAVLVFPGEAALSILLLAMVGVVGFLLLRRIRPVREPDLVYSLSALIWGMTGAVGLALVANGHLSSIWNKVGGLAFGSVWGAASTAPLNEEPLKVLGVVLIAVMAPLVVRGPIDGFILGALVGLGFQLVEDFTYSLNMILMQGGVDGMVAVVRSFFLRVGLTGLGSHWAMTAVAGAAVGLLAAASWRPGPGRGTAAALLFLLAMGMHWLFDAPLLGTVPGIVLKALSIFLTTMIVYFLLRRAHRSRVRRALAREGEELGVRRSAAMALASRGGRDRELARVARPERPAVRTRQEQMIDSAEDRAFDGPPRPDPP